jgi:hypothetical protein
MDKLPQRFQFWLGAIGKMSYIMNLIDIGTIFSQENNNSEHTVPIQSTGTHDRFGSELFFNDIVQEPNEGGIGVLVWFGDCLGIASGEVGNNHAIDQVSSGELRLYTRVGNIYENPEMVQSCLFYKGMVFYSKHFVNKSTGKPHQITVEEVKPKTNELIVSWGRDNIETWDLDLCEKGIMNGDYYFEKP